MSVNRRRPGNRALKSFHRRAQMDRANLGFEEIFAEEPGLFYSGLGILLMPSIAKVGGTDGTRTRNLCRDRAAL
jgi:hypothetical protein